MTLVGGFVKTKTKRDLAHAEQFAYLLHVRIVNEANVNEVTLLLLSLLREKACFLLILPVPVSVKRFLAPELVFTLGIC